MMAIAACVLCLNMAGPGLAQEASKASEYDTTAEVTIRGTVEDVHESKVVSDHPGLHLMVKTEEGETIEVHACPVRFLEDIEFSIGKGDRVTVLGSRAKGEAVLVAREITRGTTRITLRDAKGTPVWRR
jgi:hypothetical protein